MKLIDLKRGDKFTVNDPDYTEIGVIKHSHLDGMYSVNFIEKTGEIIHLHFATPVILEDLNDQEQSISKSE